MQPIWLQTPQTPQQDTTGINVAPPAAAAAVADWHLVRHPGKAGAGHLPLSWLWPWLRHIHIQHKAAGYAALVPRPRVSG
jgi:hypothetical protein